MNPTRILLVEDHHIVRAGLRRMLELDSDIEVVGEATDGEEALAQMPALSPDIVITDIRMPGMDGIELTRRLKKEWPACDVLVLTLYGEFLPSALEAGAVGYLLKDLRQEELVSAIRAVREGRSPLHLSLERDHLASITPGKGRAAELSEREQSVLRLIASGATTRDIARQLAFSESTVKRTLRMAFEKLDARSRSEAVAEAMKRNLI